MCRFHIDLHLSSVVIEKNDATRMELPSSLGGWGGGRAMTPSGLRLASVRDKLDAADMNCSPVSPRPRPTREWPVIGARASGQAEAHILLSLTVSAIVYVGFSRFDLIFSLASEKKATLRG